MMTSYDMYKDHFFENLRQNSRSLLSSNLATKFTWLISQKPSLSSGSSLYLKKEWMGILPAFPDKCTLLSFAILWQSLWKQMSLGVRNTKQRTFHPCFLARSMKYFLSSFLGLVLSIITLLPFLISSSATLQHFSLVFKVSRFTREYFDIQFFQKVDLPDPGLPTKMTIYLSTNLTSFPLLTTTSPTSGTVAGLKPFTSILSTSPKNRFSGVLKGVPTLRANFRSVSAKSLCFPSFLPAASPQKKLSSLLIFIPPLFCSRTSHILVPGFLYSSSEVATNTCISTPISLAMLATFFLISPAGV